MSTTTERVRALVAPLLEQRGLDLYDVEVGGATLRVLVDREGGVDLDTIGEVARDVSRALDDDDPMPDRYTLEVSSPGLERPLRLPSHYANAVGQRVSVKTVPGTEGDRRITGLLVTADDEGFEVEGRRLTYDEVERARTVFEWGPTPKPGKGQKGSKP